MIYAIVEFNQLSQPLVCTPPVSCSLSFWSFLSVGHQRSNGQNQYCPKLKALGLIDSVLKRKQYFQILYSQRVPSVQVNSKTCFLHFLYNLQGVNSLQKKKIQNRYVRKDRNGSAIYLVHCISFDCTVGDLHDAPSSLRICQSFC